MDAIILAAGVGKRLSQHHYLPKGLIKLGECTLIERSIALLIKNKIKKILIITGYKKEYYNALLKDFKNVDMIYNPHYEEKGSLYTFSLADEWITKDFLLLESDIVYPSYCLKILLESPSSEAILVSGKTDASDEVYVEHNDLCLSSMSKNTDDLNKKNIIGEFVGVSKISVFGYRELFTLINKANIRQHAYETDGLVALGHKRKILCAFINDLIWSEIDTLEQWERAKRIYPLIENQ
jgi:choline kinase